MLLVEDTPANQKLVVRVLQKRGHAVEVAPDGREALERLSQGCFDVVLMDVQMPVMDGLQATTAIRALPDPALAHVPIIGITAHAMQCDRQRCLDAGMDAHLAKPVRSRELFELVEHWADRGSRNATSCSALFPAEG